MQTGNFHTARRLPGAIAISRTVPWFYHGKTYPRLAPAADELRDLKDGLIGEREYMDTYECRILGPLDAAAVHDELVALAAPHEPVLLCWCSAAERRCHRFAAAAWLERKLGISIREYGTDGQTTINELPEQNISKGA